MTAAHVTLAWVSAAMLAVLAVVAVATATGRLRTHLALDRALLAQLVAAGLAALAGLVSFAAVGPSMDPLHLLYGGLVVTLPVAGRVIGHGTSPGRMARWVAGAAIVALGATVRSFMTGS